MAAPKITAAYLTGIATTMAIAIVGVIIAKRIPVIRDYLL